MLKRFHLSGHTEILSIDSNVRILLDATIIDPGSERANKSFHTNDIKYSIYVQVFQRLANTYAYKFPLEVFVLTVFQCTWEQLLWSQNILIYLSLNEKEPVKRED